MGKSWRKIAGQIQIEGAKYKKGRIKKGGNGGMLMGIRKKLITGEEVEMEKKDEKEGLIIEDINIRYKKKNGR